MSTKVLEYKGQSRFQSLVEQLCMVSSGMFIALTVTQGLAWLSSYTHWFKLEVGIGSNLIITIIMTFVSIGRGFYVRRLFEWLHKAQSFKQSLFEVVVNRILGIGTGICTLQIIAYLGSFIPLFNFSLDIQSNIVLTLIITFCSTCNGQFWRRHFNKLATR